VTLPSWNEATVSSLAAIDGSMLAHLAHGAVRAHDRGRWAWLCQVQGPVRSALVVLAFNVRMFDPAFHVTLAPGMQRGHAAAYAALAHGAIDVELLRELLAVQHNPHWRPDFAVDTTTWPRVYAHCSAGRSHYYHPARHMGGHPVVAGWSYQWITGLNNAADSWTAPLDAQRLDPGENPSTVAVRQIEALIPRLGPLMAEPLFDFDAGYDLVRLTEELRGENVQLLVRIRGNRRFRMRPPQTVLGREVPRPPQGGRPPLHGKVLRCLDSQSWREPDYGLGKDLSRWVVDVCG